MNTSGDAVLKEFSEAGNLPLEGTYAKTYTYGSKVELAPGIYSVTLIATYAFGGIEQSVTLDTKQLTVTNTAPVANARIGPGGHGNFSEWSGNYAEWFCIVG